MLLDWYYQYEHCAYTGHPDEVDTPTLLPLPAEPLTAAAFAPFGEVIESDGRAPLLINDGMTERFHDLARVDVQAGDGRPLINLFHALPYVLPLRIRELERHPLGSQAFVPLDRQPFLVVVAPAGEAPTAASVRAFLTNGLQGVNYGRGVWHHSLIVLGEPSRFLVVDRGGSGNNCDLFTLAAPLELQIRA